MIIDWSLISPGSLVISSVDGISDTLSTYMDPSVWVGRAGRTSDHSALTPLHCPGTGRTLTLSPETRPPTHRLSKLAAAHPVPSPSTCRLQGRPLGAKAHQQPVRQIRVDPNSSRALRRSASSLPLPTPIADVATEMHSSVLTN